MRAYDRWAYDTFGSKKDRLLLSGAIGSIQDVKGTIKELEWIAEHGFVGTYAPGFVRYPNNDLPPLYDEFWDPIWSAYEDLDLVPIVHAGYGFEQGFAHGMIAESHNRVKGAGGSDLDLIVDLTSGYFNDEGFFKDVKCRRAMWQMMLGGVFDRHPKLRLMMTEVRADWVPATLDHLDKVFAENRDVLPATRPPSEQWQEHCLAGLSFMHTAEIEMRHEIGIDTIAFGRDYPHTESTWPNTDQYLKVLFSGVPEDETRKMLGENAIRFFGLDQDHLAKIAARDRPRDVRGHRPRRGGRSGPDRAPLDAVRSAQAERGRGPHRRAGRPARRRGPRRGHGSRLSARRRSPCLDLDRSWPRSPGQERGDGPHPEGSDLLDAGKGPEALVEDGVEVAHLVRAHPERLAEHAVTLEAVPARRSTSVVVGRPP